MPFDLSAYEPVEERLARFWADHPNGRVYTELVGNGHAGESVVIIASVYKDKADLYPDATGHAQETPGSNPVNKTSWIENCETSAIGRALANMGYAPKGQRPSREEMQKAAKPLAARAPKPPAKYKPRASHIALLDAAKDASVDTELRHRIIRFLTRGAHESVKTLQDDQADKITAQLAYFQTHRDAAMKELEAWEAAQ